MFVVTLHFTHFYTLFSGVIELLCSRATAMTLGTHTMTSKDDPTIRCTRTIIGCPFNHHNRTCWTCMGG